MNHIAHTAEALRRAAVKFLAMAELDEDDVQDITAAALRFEAVAERHGRAKCMPPNGSGTLSLEERKVLGVSPGKSAT